MAAIAMQLEEQALVVSYDVTEEAITELRSRFTRIRIDGDPANYETGRRAIGTLRDLRVKIEKRRKDLKADSLAFGRKVDAVAKKLTGMIEEIEEPLIQAKRAVDEEEERKKREAERAELIALEQKLEAERQEREATARAEREAEDRRLAGERQRLEEQKAAQAAAEAEIEAERQRVREESRRVEREARELDERKERERRASVAPVPAAPAPPPAEQAEASTAETASDDAPSDLDRVRAYAGRIRELRAAAPALAGPCSEAIEWARERLELLAVQLEEFQPGHPKRGG